MRICFITSEFVTEENFSGGLANYLSRITVALREAGHEVVVITRSTQAGHVEYRGIPVHRVVPTWGRLAGLRMDRLDGFAPRAFYAQYQDVKAAWCLWRHWRKLRRAGPAFDIVQVANVCAVGLFFRREAPTAIVARLSSYRPVWDRLALPVVRHRDRLRWLLEALSVRGRRHVYAPSGYVARLWEKHEGLPRVTVIPTPFVPPAGPEDPAVLRRIGAERPFLLFFGRMNRLKGVHLLAEALPAVLERHPDLRAVFLGNDGASPSGGGMQDYVRERLAAFADRVTIVPAVPSNQLLPVVAAARLVVLPSLADNLPNAGLEAISLGRPVVAFRGSCFEEMIRHDETGFLVEPAYANALADALNALLDRPAADLDRVGAAARSEASRWHPDAILPRILGYYADVIAAKPTTPR